MLFDMHMHTTLYSKCGRMSPEAMAQRAVQVGLDGIVVTEHNAIWTDSEVQELRQSFPGLTILRGVEVSAKDCHILVYGITDFTGFKRGMPARDVVELAHARRGAAVWAHPLLQTTSPPSEISQVRFDACETRSINIDDYEHEAYDAFAKELGVPAMSNSDAHHDVVVGTYATRFDATIGDEAELAAAIRAGAFVPEVRTQWLEAVWPLRVAYWEREIQELLDAGTRDPAAIKRETGASVARIEAFIQARLQGGSDRQASS